MQTENLLTTAELATYAPELNLAGFADTTVSGIISRASEQVRNYCHVDGFLQKPVTSETDRVIINTDGELIISVRRPNVAQGHVTRIGLKTIDINQTMTLVNNGLDTYFIPAPGKYVVYPSNYLIAFGTGLLSLQNANLFYEIDYVGGYATDVANLPADLKEATALMVQSIVSRRANPTGLIGFKQGNYQEERRSKNGTYTNPFKDEAIEILNRGNFVRMVI